MRLSSGHVHANRPRCRNGQDTRGVYGWFQQPSSDETASRARRTQRTAVAQAYGVQEGEGVRASGGPEADLVAAVAPHLALRAVALALRAYVLAERDVVERALRLDLGLHAVRHALVDKVPLSPPSLSGSGSGQGEPASGRNVDTACPWELGDDQGTVRKLSGAREIVPNPGRSSHRRRSTRWINLWTMTFGRAVGDRCLALPSLMAVLACAFTSTLIFS